MKFKLEKSGPHQKEAKLQHFCKPGNAKPGTGNLKQLARHYKRRNKRNSKKDLQSTNYCCAWTCQQKLSED